MNIYFYKLACDDCGAPSVRNNLLSLAICKPMIRSTADKGDLIFGFAATSLHRNNRLIYVAVVTDKLCCGRYYRDLQFRGRPDCIYGLRGGRFFRRGGAQYHLSPGDLAHDLGNYPNYKRANVLLSTNFRYFGRDGSDDYKSDFPRIKTAIESLGRGHRVYLHPDLHREFTHLKERLWASRRQLDVGKPTSAPKPKATHRGGGCGVWKMKEPGRSHS